MRAFIQKAIELNEIGVATAIAIGYDTSQRLGDILRATWTKYDGSSIRFNQSKTSAKVICPLRQNTIDLINSQTRTSVTIVTDHHGKPFTNNVAFNRSFRAVRRALGITRDLTFRDLRRTAATEIMAGGGRSEPLTGHAPGSRVLKVYEVPNLAGAKNAQAVRQEITEIEDEE